MFVEIQHKKTLERIFSPKLGAKTTSYTQRRFFFVKIAQNNKCYPIMNTNANSSRIAKNTLFLYFRMLLVMGVSLYTSRVVLHALGVVDFGLNNVIAGIIIVFSFINNSLSTATARFLTFELGKRENQNVRNVFASAFLSHLLLAAIVLVLAETIGLYVVNNVLVIPEDRLFACNVVYHIVVISTCLNLTQAPANAMIISHERMNVYAYLGIALALSRLAIALAITYTPLDKLILMNVLAGVVSVLIYIFTYAYCHHSFKNEIKISFIIDKELLKPMLSFTTWSLIGSTAYMLKNQGINILINIFFGPAINAANAIAYKVDTAVMGFISNFSTALNPQITKTYAAKEYDSMKNLIFSGGKFSFFLMMILCIPLILETEYILKLWLGDNVPDFSIVMTQLVLILSMVESFTYSIGCAVQASGNIRNYQLVISGITLMNFPISFLAYYLGAPPYAALAISISISSLTLMLRMYFIKSLLSIPPLEYIQKVFIKAAFSLALSIPLPYLLVKELPQGFQRFLLILIVSTFTTGIVVWFLGTSHSERSFIKNAIKKKLGKQIKNA